VVLDKTPFRSLRKSTVAITKGAQKAHRASLKKRGFNDKRRKEMREAIKAVRDKLTQKNPQEAEALMSTVYKKIDKAAKRGVIKKNAAARTKSRMVAAIRKVQ